MVPKRYHNLYKIASERGGYGAAKVPLQAVRPLEGVALPGGVVEQEPSGADMTVVKKDGEKVGAFFYVEALLNGLVLPFPAFIRDVLGDFGVAPSQLTPNSWRLLFVMYCYCREEDWQLTSGVFRALYELRRSRGWYYFIARSARVVRGLPQSHKGWHDRAVWLAREGGFGVTVSWGIADWRANELALLKLSPEEEALVEQLKEVGGAGIRSGRYVQRQEDFRRLYWPGSFDGEWPTKKEKGAQIVFIAADWAHSKNSQVARQKKKRGRVEEGDEAESQVGGTQEEAEEASGAAKGVGQEGVSLAVAAERPVLPGITIREGVPRAKAAVTRVVGGKGKGKVISESQPPKKKVAGSRVLTAGEERQKGERVSADPFFMDDL